MFAILIATILHHGLLRVGVMFLPMRPATSVCNSDSEYLAPWLTDSWMSCFLLPRPTTSVGNSDSD